MSRASAAEKLPADGPILPRNASAERPLFVIMATMAFLAGLTLLISMSGFQASQNWQSDVKRALTVQILPGENQSHDNLVETGKNIIAAQLPQSRVTPLSDKIARELLKPWIGDLALPDDIPVPIVLKIDTGTDEVVDITAMKAAFSRVDIETDIDDHKRWGDNIRKTWQALHMGLTGIIIIVLAASGAVASYATHAVLRSRQTIIDVLAHVGAPDRFIVGLFTRRFTELGLKAAFVGGAGALLFLIVFSGLTYSFARDILPDIRVGAQEIVSILVLGLIMGVISGGVAATTTLYKLRRDRRDA